MNQEDPSEGDDGGGRVKPDAEMILADLLAARRGCREKRQQNVSDQFQTWNLGDVLLSALPNIYFSSLSFRDFPTPTAHFASFNGPAFPSPAD